MNEYKESDIRRLLHEYIKKNPGASFKILKNVFKMSEGNLRYHLHYLERKNQIKFEKNGRDLCYFSPFNARLKPMSDVELTPVQERIFDLIKNRPCIPTKKLMDLSGENKPSFDYNVRILRESGLIWMVHNGSTSGYRVINDERSAEELLLKMVKMFTEGQVSKEELMKIVSLLEKIKEKKTKY